LVDSAGFGEPMQLFRTYDFENSKNYDNLKKHENYWSLRLK
jgi:hypothetical protein